MALGPSPWTCTCGEPDTPRVVHRQDGPCYVVTDGKAPQPGDKDCALAKGRDHKWQWKWDIQGAWTDQAVCVHCGQERTMTRPDRSRSS